MEINNAATVQQQVLENTSTRLSDKTEEKTTIAETVKNEAKQTMEERRTRELKEDYTAISKDGDTLQLSGEQKSNEDMPKRMTVSERKETTYRLRLSDAAISKYSSGKLKQLLQRGQITKQQYEKAIKNNSK